MNTSFGEYFDNQRIRLEKTMQDKNKQLNVEWMERYNKRQSEKKKTQIWDGSLSSYIDIDPHKDKLAKTEFETLYNEHEKRHGRDMDSDSPDMESDRESSR